MRWQRLAGRDALQISDLETYREDEDGDSFWAVLRRR
jgi:hypothetical protein